MADRIQLRRDTTENWDAENPILAQGEIGVELGDPVKIKIGDGITSWDVLPYGAAPELSSLPELDGPLGDAIEFYVNDGDTPKRITYETLAAPFSLDGHAHPGVHEPIGAASAAIVAHTTEFAHYLEWPQPYPLTPNDTALEDAAEIIYVPPVSGYVTALQFSCLVAPTTDAAGFTVSRAITWGGAFTNLTDEIEIAATEYQSDRVTLGPEDQLEIYQGRPVKITLAADTGGTCAGAWMLLWLRPANLTIPDEEPPAAPQYLQRTVAWNFPIDQESTVDRFEIYRDGVKVLEEPDASVRTADILMYFDSEYTVAACNDEGCTPAGGVMVVFEPGLARNKSITASSYEAGYLPENIVDGRTSSYWGSDWENDVDPDVAEFEVDLESERSITGFRLFFVIEGRDFTVKVSSDQETYTTIHTATDNTDQVLIVDDLDETGRYVKVAFTDRRDDWDYGYVVREFEVFES